MVTVHVTNIIWDLDDEDFNRKLDIAKLNLPQDIELNFDNFDDTFIEVSNKLSDVYGFSAKSFNFEIVSIEDQIKHVLRQYFKQYRSFPDYNAAKALHDICKIVEFDE